MSETAWAHGIDISNNQGRIDFDALAKEGQVKFIIAKCCEGPAFIDHWLAYYASECARKNIALGTYAFARPSQGPPEPQADFYVALMNALGWTKDTPFVIDMEDEDFPVGADAGWWTLAFVRRVRALTGRKCLIYTYRYYITSRRLDQYPELAEYGLWLASVDGGLGAIPAPWTKAVVWQYDWYTPIAGVSGNVDADWCMEGDAEAFKRLSDSDDAMTPEIAIPAGVADPVTGYVVDPIFIAAYDFVRDGRPLAGSAGYTDGKIRQLFENAVLEGDGRSEPRRGGVGQSLAAIIGAGTRPDWPDVHPLGV